MADAPPILDLAVVGGGLAGWTAAASACERGRSVALFERAARPSGWGNSIVSGGVLHAAMLSPLEQPEDLFARIVELTDGAADETVARAWSQNAARAVRWIEEHGGALMTEPGQAYRTKVFSPVRRTVPGLLYDGFGTDNFLKGLADAVVRRGGVVHPSHRAVGLRRGADRWEVVFDTPVGRQVFGARAVALCDGGFQADRNLVRNHIGTDQVKLRATDSGTGDGLRMGLEAGGVAVHMNCFYGHLLARESLSSDALWPYPLLDGVAALGALVDPSGDRLVDEGLGGVTMANNVAWSADPAGTWVVFDDETWRRARQGGDTPPNPYLPDHGGTMLTAPDVGRLAEAAGFDPDRLRRSVDQAAGAAGASPSPPRTQPASFATPPFHAVPVVAGVTFTMGGLLVDGSARVVDSAGAPIPGLYAAGGTMGGLHGGPRAGYAGGLLEAAVFGLLAGSHA